MKGVFNKWPPLPRYSTTWSVGLVLNYLRSLGQNSDLSLKDLSHKTATLLTLCTAGRSSDLCLLSVNHFTSTTGCLKLICKGLSNCQDLITFVLFVQSYEKQPLICPVQYFEAYVCRTREFRSLDNFRLFVPGQLFLGISRPHAPVKACSIAHWVKITLASAGIDIAKYSAHSVRGASTSQRLWNQEPLFQRSSSKLIGPRLQHSTAFISGHHKWDPLVSHMLFSHQLICQNYMLILSWSTPKYNYQMAEAIGCKLFVVILGVWRQDIIRDDSPPTSL